MIFWCCSQVFVGKNIYAENYVCVVNDATYSETSIQCRVGDHSDNECVRNGLPLDVDVSHSHLLLKRHIGRYAIKLSFYRRSLESHSHVIHDMAISGLRAKPRLCAPDGGHDVRPTAVVPYELHISDSQHRLVAWWFESDHQWCWILLWSMW